MAGGSVPPRRPRKPHGRVRWQLITGAAPSNPAHRPPPPPARGVLVTWMGPGRRARDRAERTGALSRCGARGRRRDTRAPVGAGPQWEPDPRSGGPRLPAPSPQALGGRAAPVRLHLGSGFPGKATSTAHASCPVAALLPPEGGSGPPIACYVWPGEGWLTSPITQGREGRGEEGGGGSRGRREGEEVGGGGRSGRRGAARAQECCHSVMVGQAGR